MDSHNLRGRAEIYCLAVRIRAGCRGETRVVSLTFRIRKTRVFFIALTDLFMECFHHHLGSLDAMARRSWWFLSARLAVTPRGGLEQPPAWNALSSAQIGMRLGLFSYPAMLSTSADHKFINFKETGRDM